MPDRQLGLFAVNAPIPRRRSFHVRSSSMTVEEAQAGERKAQRQEEAILQWFAANPSMGRCTPSEVGVIFPEWPITSIRRALTNLTSAGKLVHYPGTRRMGPHGAMESTWGLA